MVPRVVVALLAAALGLGLGGCAQATAPRPTLDVVTDALAAAPAVDGTPSADASRALADAVVELIAGRTPAPDGWSLVPLSDVTGGRALVEQVRPTSAAGVVAVRGQGAKPVALAVPVPGGAAPAEQVAVALFTRSSALALVVAGSPTAAASVDSAFRVVSDALGARGVVLVVVEGEASDASAEGPEVVLRGATEEPSDEELRLGTVLQAAGVQACVLVGEECVDPGLALEQVEVTAGATVVRVQLSGRLATNAARRDLVVTEIARALDDL